VTLVSRSVATKIVELNFDFYLKDLILPSLLSKAEKGSFYGITNGLDFMDSSKNPFTNPKLLETGLSFPKVGEDLLDFRTFWANQVEETGSHRKMPLSFVNQKTKAKSALIQGLPKLFTEVDLNRPILLFIGRFQYNKGCDFFEPILERLNGTAKLVAMGSENNYPFQNLKSLQNKYSNQFALIYSEQIQKEWGSIIRMASDFSFVPSFTESFGLVAAEGMLFGMGVISSGVGGLVEFLKPMTEDLKHGNSYLFDALGDESRSGNVPIAEKPVKADGPEGRNKLGLVEAGIRCWNQVERAIRDWNEMLNPNLDSSWVNKESFVRRMVGQALDLSWDREQGPVFEVSDCYL
jgi:glycogen synthase